MDTLDAIKKFVNGEDEEETKEKKAEVVPVKEKPEEIVLKTPDLKPPVLDETKSYSEQAKDLVGVMATQKAINDDTLVSDVTDKKKEELKANASANLKQEQAKAKNADKTLQEANYGVYEGVATYAGIKKPLPQTMQKVLFIILSIFQIIVLICVGVPTSIINIIADCVDSIIKKLASIAKSARILVISLLIIGVCALIAYIIYVLVRRYI